jgi:hypothetical protein
MNRVEEPTYEIYFTIGSVRGYHGTPFTKDELLDAIGSFQAQHERKHGYACGVRVVPGTVIFQSYQESCWDVCVIQYPRFPVSKEMIRSFVEELALSLMEEFEQERITVVDPAITTMLEKEGADQSRIHESPEGE